MASHLGRILFVSCLLNAGAAVATDDAFRCGGRLIEIGMTQSEVLQYCGAPTARSEEVRPVRSGSRVVGQTTVQRWTYESYSRKRVLVFDQDKLRSIE